MSLTLKQRLLLKTAPLPASFIVRGLAASWRIQELGPQVRYPQGSGEERYIYAFWHEYIIPTIGYFRDLPIHGLASLSFDGDLVSDLMDHLGYLAPARGSSSRGGTGALMELLAFLRAGDHVCISVDGPRGPRRKARDGAVKLAQLSGKAVVPVGFASTARLRLRSWDQTLIPPPFSRGAFSFGEPFHVPADGSLAHYLDRLQVGLDQACLEAEAILKP